MLVLSRRPNETIVFPGLGVTVEILKIKGNIARVGIQAPRDLEILRGELVRGDEHWRPAETREREPQKSLSHEMRNRLNLATIGLALLKRQLGTGQMQQANLTVQRVLDELAVLDKDAQGSDAVIKSLRALLVEDSATERQLLAGYLRKSGFQVDTAGDGAEAIDYLAHQPRPDVVLMDMMMPTCDGPTAVRAIRCNPRLEGLKIFAVSGASPSKLGLETGPRGIDRWFQKPLDPEQLVDEISRDFTPAA